MEPVSFYGRRRKRVVLPPINQEQSDGDDSNDSVPEVFADNSDDDPDYMPDAPSTSRNTRVLVVEETDTESESEDNQRSGIQQSTSATDNNRPTSRERNFKWVKEDISVNIENSTVAFVPESLTPLEYFKRFFSTELIDHIVTQTNLYSVQETASSVNTNCSELEQFIGILIYMGIVVMPSYTDYWAQATNCGRVSQIFSLKRFQKLRRYIHFSNNQNSGDSEDRLFKIRPVFDIILENCRKLEQEQEHSIDEMMVPYKGTRAGNLRQYIQNKPHKWGYKIFMRTGVSGLIYDFLPYTGKGMATNLTAEEKIFGIGGQVVIMLCKSLPPDMNARVYFDNFFCTLELIIFLKNRNIDSLGTLRKNRLKGCPLEEEKVLQKRGRGMYDYRKDVTSDVIVVRWVDNKVVCMASSFCGIQPLSTVKRWNTNEKRKTDVPCPNIVTQYNKHMGGVDLAGMLIELYRTPLKSKRWYLRLFAFSIDLCVVNAWLLYRRETGDRKTSLKSFRADIANALMTSNKRKAGRQSTDATLPQPKKKATIPIPVQDTRYDCVDHWPEYGAKGRCRYCPKGYSTVRCTKCELVLCFVPGRHCFMAFHTKK